MHAALQSARRPLAAAALVVASAATVAADDRWLPEVAAAMQELVEARDVAGAVTVVAGREGVLHLDATGWADIASGRPMTPDTLFWIASMTKPVTGAAVAMLIDEGTISIDDPVETYVPEFANLVTASGRPARITIRQILTHTSGLGEAPVAATRAARTLADLVPAWLAAPMKNEPGEKWAYTQSGINLAGLIVEKVSGRTFDAFLEERLFGPLGMVDTTFYPSDAQRARLATGYLHVRGSDRLEPAPARAEYGARPLPPQGNGGLYSTPRDYTRFVRMLLNGGSLDGRAYLGEAGMRALSTVQTGALPTGFFQAAESGGWGANYGWGLGTCVLREPHDGVAAMLSPGTFGHGGAWGTQAWVDPVRGVAYVLMVQRANFPNSDASDVRRRFQEAAAAALFPDREAGR
ncbi:MAG: Esterase EstB [Planctomycetota bacterium]|jgi:CubicO group peptidase (beta-lactamase class C family)